MSDRADEPEPGAGIEVGLSVALALGGVPASESAIAALSPPDTVVVMTELPLAPCDMDSCAGDAESVRFPEVGLKMISTTG